MKRFFYISLLALLIGIPSFGYSQSGSYGGVKTTLVIPTAPQSFGGIPRDVLVQILTQAAPFFGYLPDAFIDLYHTCNCITVEQIGSNTYLVVYGGLGIQIIIDGSRFSGGTNNITNGAKR